MKDEEKEIQGELVPVERPAFEVVEQTDDQAIIAMMTGQAIQEYVYSFKQGGRVVQGLTLAGINEAANRRGGITVEDIQYEDRENSWLVIVKATDTFTGNSRYGAYEQPKKAGAREDPFAFTKAVHKAQRNAIKQLLPVPIIREVLNFYLQKTGQTPIEPASQPTKQTPSNDNIPQAQKAAFASANKLRERLEQEDIPQTVLWSYVKRRYGVESRNDMTERQWTELAAELQSASSTQQLFNDFVKRVKQMMAAAKDSEVPSEETEVIDVEVIEPEKFSPAPRAVRSAARPKAKTQTPPSGGTPQNEMPF